MTEPVRLRIALGKHQHIAPLRDGRVTSRRVTLEFLDIEPLPHAFREMVRGGNIDICEMAVITHLLAHHFGKPLVGLAIPLWNRLPHANLVCRSDSAISSPTDLTGTLVGVRAYAQTSGVWVRGILASDYGVDLSKVRWGTMEDAHLAEYRDPSNCWRYPPEPPLRDLLLRGEFSAIMGERVVDPSSIRTVIPEAEKAAREWIAREGIEPINHTLVLRGALHAQYPWLAAELMEMFREAYSLARTEGAPVLDIFGLSDCQGSLERALHYAFAQAITPRLYRPEEMYLPL